VYENLILSLSLVCVFEGLLLSRPLHRFVLPNCLGLVAALSATVAIGDRRKRDCGAESPATCARQSVAGHFTAAPTIDDSG
jgi:hypothetical protein